LAMDTLETSCIFRSAFHVCQGADLLGIKVSNNGRRIATFQLIGEGLYQQDKAYRSGEALVNPLQLREALNHVRDRLFKRLKNENEGRRGNEIRRSCQNPATNRSNDKRARHR
jgi:hypothetical protein